MAPLLLVLSRRSHGRMLPSQRSRASSAAAPGHPGAAHGPEPVQSSAGRSGSSGAPQSPISPMSAAFRILRAAMNKIGRMHPACAWRRWRTSALLSQEVGTTEGASSLSEIPLLAGLPAHAQQVCAHGSLPATAAAAPGAGPTAGTLRPAARQNGSRQSSVRPALVRGRRLRVGPWSAASHLWPVRRRSIQRQYGLPVRAVRFWRGGGGPGRPSPGHAAKPFRLADPLTLIVQGEARVEAPARRRV